MVKKWIEPTVDKIKMTVREKVSDVWRAANTVMLGLCTFFLVGFYNKQEARGTKLDDVLIRLAVQEQLIKHVGENAEITKDEVKEIKVRVNELRMQVNKLEK